MPSCQILYLMMFVGNLACTSHVLQYSSSRSYEHSRFHKPPNFFVYFLLLYPKIVNFVPKISSNNGKDKKIRPSEEDDEESYLLGLTLPKHKFIGPAKQEFHIRIKLNNAPVNIWRELVVPSNITLEMLAYVLIDAMNTTSAIRGPTTCG